MEGRQQKANNSIRNGRAEGAAKKMRWHVKRMFLEGTGDDYYMQKRAELRNAGHTVLECFADRSIFKRSC